MHDLIEKVARAMVNDKRNEEELWPEWKEEAKAAIAAVLKDQLKRFEGDAEIQIAISDYARENGVSLDE